MDNEVVYFGKRSRDKIRIKIILKDLFSVKTYFFQPYFFQPPFPIHFVDWATTKKMLMPMYVKPFLKLKKKKGISNTTLKECQDYVRERVILDFF